MTVEYSSVECKTALSNSRLPGLRYSMNPYVGCEHGCAYCYSPSVLGDPRLAINWGKTVRAKQNIVEVLTRELKRKQRGVVGISTITDPYQPIEAKLEITRKCIETLLKNDFPMSIQTKSDMVLRDIDLITKGKVDVGVTITTMDRRIANLLEPKASPPDARAKVLKELSSRGVETWLFLGPIIPGLNDSIDNLKMVIEVAVQTKSKVIYDKLNLKRWVMERLGPRLEYAQPGLARRLPDLVSFRSEYWRRLCSKIETICKNLEVKCESAFASPLSGL